MQKIYVWGSVCKRGHDKSGGGHSLRHPKNHACVDCTREARKASRHKAKQAKALLENVSQIKRSRIRFSPDFMPFQFRLRPSLNVKTELPEDLTQKEACRLAAAITTATFAYDENKIFEFLHQFYGHKLTEKLMEMEGYEKQFVKRKAA